LFELLAGEMENVLDGVSHCMQAEYRVLGYIKRNVLLGFTFLLDGIEEDAAEERCKSKE